ncbi:MAG TPA: ATP-binding protein [Solirubrobacterales bacterium]|nr:ATP-binding protein [Solirubrobacterales bacterium]
MPLRLRSDPPVTRLTRRAFWRRFGRLEHERLEFKASANHVLASIVAMAMTDGGTILVGVTDDRRLVGCSPLQPTLDRLGAIAYETEVDLAVSLVVVGRAVVVCVDVPAIRDRVVTTPDGRVLRRIGSANHPVRGDAVARFVRARDALGSGVG